VTHSVTVSPVLNSERARPLPPEERRASLVAAAIPIFRVFTDKTELVQAAINSAFDPEQTLTELGEIDMGLPLHERCLAIVTILQSRLLAVFKIMIAIRMAPGQQKYRPKHDTAPGPHLPAGQAVPPGAPPGAHVGNPAHRPPGPPLDAQTERISAEVVRLLEPDRDELTRPVREVAQLLRLLTFSGSHPFISEGHLLTAEQITSTILDGVRRRPDTPNHGGPRC
jgi:hypothetical protein